MRTIALLISLLGASLRARAEDIPCSEVRTLVAAAKAPNIASLSAPKPGETTGYRLTLVTAYRSFQLQPRSQSAAAKLLGLIPADDSQQTVVATLGDSLCQDESFAEMGVLARIRDNLPLQLSRAVALAPHYLRAYVQYSRTATLDPHSDYAVQMQAVCLRRHEAFLKALDDLAPELRTNIARYVMRPDSCKAIRTPEADH